MTAADVQAIAESVTAASAALALAGWTARKLQRARKRYKDKRAKRVQNDAFPLIAGVTGIALFVAWLVKGGDS